MSSFRIGDRVTVTNPTEKHAQLIDMRGTIDYLAPHGLLVTLDDGDEALFQPHELNDGQIGDLITTASSRILARLGR